MIPAVIPPPFLVPDVIDNYIRVANLGCISLLLKTNGSLEQPQQGREKKQKGNSEGGLRSECSDDNKDDDEESDDDGQ